MAVNIVAGLARDAALRGFETAAGSYLLRGDVEDWLAEKHSEDLRVQRSTLRWAKIAGWAGIAGRGCGYRGCNQAGKIGQG